MRKNLYIFSFLVLMFSCTGVPDFSNIPSISYNNLRIITTEKPTQLGVTKKDSVIISINFQDGDGDLGFNTQEFAALQKKYGLDVRTFLIDLYVKKNGKFVLSDPSVKFGGNILFHLKDGTKAGPIEGVVDYSVNFEYLNFAGIPNLTGKKDTVKFEITIKDRAMNTSNTTETPEVVIFNQ
ncbi:hypothetical protein VB264_10670 [Arcicella aquatica]|uniref:Uncharacterized protein n=1 Tax=Arcicella aquatica TaxID=217141 RepID=A0ABU5QMK1_9BACT|nr:hypothetical protein [Arcicella aquatica]MEA5258243.1 hypothetical protein [Arcicella aquatica]